MDARAPSAYTRLSRSLNHLWFVISPLAPPHALRDLLLTYAPLAHPEVSPDWPPHPSLQAARRHLYSCGAQTSRVQRRHAAHRRLQCQGAQDRGLQTERAQGGVVRRGRHQTRRIRMLGHAQCRLHGAGAEGGGRFALGDAHRRLHVGGDARCGIQCKESEHTRRCHRHASRALLFDACYSTPPQVSNPLTTITTTHPFL